MRIKKFIAEEEEVMTLKELYQVMDGNYEKAITRFINEDMLKTFFGKYFESTSFQELEKAMETEEIQAAFEAAHSLKGLTQSMEFTKMSEFCVLLTEDLRAGKCTDQTKEYWKQVKENYLHIKKLGQEIK